MTAYINFVRIPEDFELSLTEDQIKELVDDFGREHAYDRAKDALEFLKNNLTGNIGMEEDGFHELNEVLHIMDVMIYSMEIYGSDAGNIIDLNVLEKNIKASEKILDENNNPKEENYFYIDLDNIKKLNKK